MASLQLLCTVGGNQARLDARAESEISQRSLKGGISIVKYSTKDPCAEFTSIY